MKGFHRFCGLLLCIILPLISETHAHDSKTTSTTSTNEFTLKQLGHDSKIILDGHNPETALYLPLPRYLNMQKIMLHLKMNFSAHLVEGTSVTLQFNETSLGTWSIPDNAARTLEIDIELPVMQLSPSWQTLRFSTVLQGNKNTCDPDIWIAIAPESSITISTLQGPFTGTLNQLPLPFIEFSTIIPVPTVLLLPKSPDLQEIFAVMQVAFQLGQLTPDATTNISSGIIDDNIDKEDGNIILIGTLPHILDNTSPEIKNLLQKNALHSEFSAGNGVLLLTPSPANAKRGLLAITGSDGQALQKATEAFLSDEFKMLTSGNLAIIDAMDMRPPTTKIGNWYEATFQDLGYPDQNISGLGRHTVRFDIPLPNNRIPIHTRIKTFITTPIFDDKGFSQITLVVNDHKQASYWLKETHARMTTDIDANAMKPGLNKVEYLVDLHFSDPGLERCTRANYDEVWATIYAQSSIETAFSGEYPLAMLDELPIPFEGNLTAILPEPLSSEDINRFSQLFFKLGQIFKPHTLKLVFRTSNQVDEDFIHNNNVLIAGTSKNNPWVPFVLKHMPAQLQGKDRVLKLHEKYVQVSGNASTGLLELSPALLNDKRAVLLITGNDQTGLYNAIEALTDNAKRYALEGNIAFINADKSIETLNNNDNRYINPFTRFSAFIRNMANNIYHTIRNHPEILIYILVFLVPLIILLRNRRKR